jgi:hypothetical protein
LTALYTAWTPPGLCVLLSSNMKRRTMGAVMDSTTLMP